MSDIPTVTYYAYSGTRYIGQYSGEDSAVLAFIAGKGYTTGPKPLATDRDLWVSIVADATAAAEAAEDAASGLEGPTAKLAGIEEGADVTDTANVTAAGALMDSEVTNLADVKAFDPADYAAAIHTHAISDVTGLQAELDGKAATGDVFSGAYADLTGKPTLGTAAALDVGATANKVVQLDGSGKLPAVDGSQLIGAGSLVLLSSTTVSSAVSAITADVTGYASYKIIVSHLRASASGAADVCLRVSDDGGATFESGTTYNYYSLASGSGTTTFSATKVVLFSGVGDAASIGGISCELNFHPGGGGVSTHLGGIVQNGQNQNIISSRENSLTESDAIQIFIDGKNIGSGTVQVFGLGEPV